MNNRGFRKRKGFFFNFRGTNNYRGSRQAEDKKQTPTGRKEWRNVQENVQKREQRKSNKRDKRRWTSSVLPFTQLSPLLLLRPPYLLSPLSPLCAMRGTPTEVTKDDNFIFCSKRCKASLLSVASSSPSSFPEKKMQFICSNAYVRKGVKFPITQW